MGALTRFPTSEVTTGELVSAGTEAGLASLGCSGEGRVLPRCQAPSDCSAAVIGNEPNLDERPRNAWRLPNCGVTTAGMGFTKRHPGVAPGAGRPDG